MIVIRHEDVVKHCQWEGGSADLKLQNGCNFTAKPHHHKSSACANLLTIGTLHTAVIVSKVGYLRIGKIMDGQKRKPKPIRCNPIQVAVQRWLNSSSAPSELIDAAERELLVGESPKRYTVYEPMLLLPTGSLTSPAWTRLLRTADAKQLENLWREILEQVSKQGKDVLSHLATNEGIPLQDGSTGTENLLRSPTGLRMLYGDFGPESASEDDATDEDFQETFWVSTKQNGIVQQWAPRWTMFSRGNIKEKARLLEFQPAADRTSDTWAVDLYAGIGYFVFSYAKLGMRVLCWEINSWSVEGLRRGAVANGWSVKVVRGDELRAPMKDIVAGGEQIIVLLESNEKAVGRLRELDEYPKVAHVNCGFLPSSRPIWESAWELTQRSSESWLHLHDNVGTHEVEARKAEIQGLCQTWDTSDDAQGREGTVTHVEYVKTFAPGVWHCVFDVHITGSLHEGNTMS